MTHLKTRATAVAAALLFLGATIYSLRFAWADILLNRDDPASAAEAVRFMPLNSQARFRKAALFAAEGTSDGTDLREAVALNPRNADAWMALGLEAESHGDLKQAEAYLLQAAAIDHTFKPAWTVANFYARTGAEEQFWHWVRTCLEMAQPQNHERETFDLRPLFDLCWSVTNDSDRILQAVPRTNYLLGKYTVYLMGSERPEAALQAAQPLLPVATPADLPVVAGLCELLLARDRISGSVQAWNAMADRHLIPRQPLHPEAGASLTNTNFQSAPLQYGFDWRLPRPNGIYDSYSAQPAFLKFEFDGEEPEHAELLVQWLPLLPGRRYRLETRYEITGMSPEEGGSLHWQTAVPGTGNLASLDFSAPAKSSLDRLVLRYDRAPGTTRPKGTLKLYATALQLQP